MWVAWLFGLCFEIWVKWWLIDLIVVTHFSIWVLDVCCLLNLELAITVGTKVDCVCCLFVCWLLLVLVCFFGFVYLTGDCCSVMFVSLLWLRGVCGWCYLFCRLVVALFLGIVLICLLCVLAFCYCALSLLVCLFVWCCVVLVFLFCFDYMVESLVCLWLLVVNALVVFV